MTLTLACRHQLTRYLADHPQALRGFLIRCPTCSALRTVWLVKSVATASGSAGSEHTGMGAGHRISIVGGDDPFRPGGGGAGGRLSDDGFPHSGVGAGVGGEPDWAWDWAETLAAIVEFVTRQDVTAEDRAAARAALAVFDRRSRNWREQQSDSSPDVAGATRSG